MLSIRKQLPVVRAVGGACRLQLGFERSAFEAQVATITKLVELLENTGVVNFAGSGLMPPGMVGNLIISNRIEVFANVSAEIPFRNLEMIKVCQHFHMARTNRLQDPQGRLTAVETVPLVIDANIHRLENQG